MFSGMMWFDNDPKKTLTEKVVEAATWYRTKYGAVPDTCFVNLKMLSEPEMRVGRVAVKPLRLVLPGHLWIGISAEARDEQGE